MVNYHSDFIYMFTCRHCEISINFYEFSFSIIFSYYIWWVSLFVCLFFLIFSESNYISQYLWKHYWYKGGFYNTKKNYSTNETNKIRQYKMYNNTNMNKIVQISKCQSSRYVNIEQSLVTLKTLSPISHCCHLKLY